MDEPSNDTLACQKLFMRKYAFFAEKSRLNVKGSQNEWMSMLVLNTETLRMNEEKNTIAKTEFAWL